MFKKINVKISMSNMFKKIEKINFKMDNFQRIIISKKEWEFQNLKI